jgi:phenylalanyl-tRNA synthetase beta chain
VRLFEYGVRFTRAQAAISEVASLAGLTLGARLPEQWGAPPVTGDVYDMKSDVEALFALTGVREEFSFQPGWHPALHPGRSAEIRRTGEPVGWIGELHPALTARLELPAPPMLFELAVERAFAACGPKYQGISRFPAVRRDLALVVNRDVNAAALVQAIRQAAPAVLREVTVFDIYAGPQVGPLEKSVAIGLILQDASRTLTDAEVDRILETVTAAVSREFNARIRE